MVTFVIIIILFAGSKGEINEELERKYYKGGLTEKLIRDLRNNKSDRGFMNILYIALKLFACLSMHLNR
jgi:hypothetical protein